MFTRIDELTNHPRYLDQWLEHIWDAGLSEGGLPDRERQLLGFQDNLKISHRLRIDDEVYELIIYPMEIEGTCPPHFHMHRKYSNYVNDHCIRLDEPRYFMHDSEHPIGLPEFMDAPFYAGNRVTINRFIEGEDKIEFDKFMREDSGLIQGASNWEMLVESWNYHYPDSKIDTNKISCPDYTQIH